MLNVAFMMLSARVILDFIIIINIILIKVEAGREQWPRLKKYIKRRKKMVSPHTGISHKRFLFITFHKRFSL